MAIDNRYSSGDIGCMAEREKMSIGEIVTIGSGAVIVLGAIVTVVYTISNHPNYKYCDDTFMRKDLHSQEYKTLLEKIEKLQEAVDELKKSGN